MLASDSINAGIAIFPVASISCAFRAFARFSIREHDPTHSTTSLRSSIAALDITSRLFIAGPRLGPASPCRVSTCRAPLIRVQREGTGSFFGFTIYYYLLLLRNVRIIRLRLVRSYTRNPSRIMGDMANNTPSVPPIPESGLEWTPTSNLPGISRAGSPVAAPVPSGPWSSPVVFTHEAAFKPRLNCGGFRIVYTPSGYVIPVLFSDAPSRIRIRFIRIVTTQLRAAIPPPPNRRPCRCRESAARKFVLHLRGIWTKRI